MNKNKFIIELSELLEKYKMDKFCGFESKFIAIAIFNILFSLYDLPSNSKFN